MNERSGLGIPRSWKAADPLLPWLVGLRGRQNYHAPENLEARHRSFKRLSDPENTSQKIPTAPRSLGRAIELSGGSQNPGVPHGRSQRFAEPPRLPQILREARRASKRFTEDSSKTDCSIRLPVAEVLKLPRWEMRKRSQKQRASRLRPPA